MWTASLYGHAQVLKLLIAVGTDPNRPGKLNVYPLHAAGANATDFISLRLDFPTDSCGPVPKGHLECVNVLLAAGVDPNVLGCGDATSPLMMAAQHGYLDICEALINAGADLDIGMREGGARECIACLY